MNVVLNSKQIPNKKIKNSDNQNFKLFKKIKPLKALFNKDTSMFCSMMSYIISGFYHALVII